MASAALLRSPWAFALCAVAVCAVHSSVPVSLVVGPDVVSLSNGFAFLQFNLLRGSVDVLQGRFEGDGDFSRSPSLAPDSLFDVNEANLIPWSPIGAASVVVIGNGSTLAETSTSSAPVSLTPTVLANTPSYAAFSLAMQDGGRTAAPARIASVLTVSLGQADRGFHLNVSTSTTPGAVINATAITLRLWFSPQSAMMTYVTGSRQGSLVTGPFLASQVPWTSFTGVGRKGCVDVLPLDNVTSNMGTVLFAGVWDGARSGFDLVLAGTVRDNGWSDGLEYNGNSVFLGGNVALPTASLLLTPNNYDFAASSVPSSGPQTAMDVQDQRSILTALASPLGALHSYDYSPETRIAPCIGINGDNCYAGTYNYFDPDSFLSVSAMLWSFQLAAVSAARGLVETNLQFACPGNVPGQSCEKGQGMHHFVEGCSAGDHWCWCTDAPDFAPGEVGHGLSARMRALDGEGRNATGGRLGMQVCVSYEALSGAVQTGPNIFTTWAALRVASSTGDLGWLASHMPDLRTSLAFLLRRLDPSVNLFFVPGSLMIDTFRRNNYTLDTNAAMVLLLERAADAEAALGNATGAAGLLGVAAAVRAAIPQYMWAPSNDHLCTQADAGSPVIPCARDFVDYDSNLLAVAAGVVNGTRAAAVLARIDSGPCAHEHATWVSEVYYDAANCFLGNTGDSAISMGRISWLDALARRAVDTPESNAFLLDTILAPIQSELLLNTWMYERYQCQGKPAHSPYYIEMPEVVSMIIVEAKYGLGGFSSFTTFTVDPAMGVDTFTFAPVAGSPVVQYDAMAGSFTASLPFVTPGTRAFSVTRMPPGTYTVTTIGGDGGVEGRGTTVPVGPDGVLLFNGPVGVGTSVSAVKST